MRTALLLALLAAGCTAAGEPRGVGGRGEAAGDPRVAACREEAASAPEVAAVRRRQPPAANADAFGRWREALEAAQAMAFSACLGREGVVTRAGGVEVPGALSPELDGIAGRPAAPTARPAATGY